MYHLRQRRFSRRWRSRMWRANDRSAGDAQKSTARSVFLRASSRGVANARYRGYPRKRVRHAVAPISSGNARARRGAARRALLRARRSRERHCAFSSPLHINNVPARHLCFPHRSFCTFFAPLFQHQCISTAAAAFCAHNTKRRDTAFCLRTRAAHSRTARISHLLRVLSFYHFFRALPRTHCSARTRFFLLHRGIFCANAPWHVDVKMNMDENSWV